MIITINEDLTSHITTEDNLLECFIPSYNPETLKTFVSRGEVQAFAQTIESNLNYFSRVLTKAEKIEAAKAQLESTRSQMRVSMRQARLQLLLAGHLTIITDAILAMKGEVGAQARIEWEYSTEVFRSQPLTQSMQSVLSLTDLQMDDLFVAAALL